MQISDCFSKDVLEEKLGKVICVEGDESPAHLGEHADATRLVRKSSRSLHRLDSFGGELDALQDGLDLAVQHVDFVVHLEKLGVGVVAHLLHDLLSHIVLIFHLDGSFYLAPFQLLDIARSLLFVLSLLEGLSCLFVDRPWDARLDTRWIVCPSKLLGWNVCFSRALRFHLSLENDSVAHCLDVLKSCRNHIVFVLDKSLGLDTLVPLTILHLLVSLGDSTDGTLLLGELLQRLFELLIHLLTTNFLHSKFLLKLSNQAFFLSECFANHGVDLLFRLIVCHDALDRHLGFHLVLFLQVAQVSSFLPGVRRILN